MEFKWKHLEGDSKVRTTIISVHLFLKFSFVLIFYFIFNYEIHYQETSIASSWYELLSVVHMMAMLSLSEANTILIPKDGIDTSERMVSEGLFLL